MERMSLTLGLVCLALSVMGSSADWRTPMSIAQVASGNSVVYLTISDADVIVTTSPVADSGQFFSISPEWPLGEFTISNNELYLDGTNRVLSVRAYTGQVAQKWTYDYYGQIVNVANGRRLTVPTMANYTAADDVVFLSATLLGGFTPFASWVFVAYSQPDEPFYTSLSSASAAGGGKCIGVQDKTSAPSLSSCSSTDVRQAIQVVGSFPYADFQLKFMQSGYCLGSGNIQVPCDSRTVNTRWFYNARGQLYSKSTGECVSIDSAAQHLASKATGSCTFDTYLNRWLFREAPKPAVVCFKWTKGDGTAAGTYYTVPSSPLPCPTGYGQYYGKCYQSCKAGESQFSTGLSGTTPVPSNCYTACSSAWPVDNGAWCTNNLAWANQTWPFKDTPKNTVVMDCTTE